MLNSREEYERAGKLASVARSNGDEALARHWSEWVRKAIALERGDDKVIARQLFDAAYKQAAEANQRWRNLSARW
jgi:hypothetical protein